MLAGVGGVDACMFVVAATEGWKPQSEEHLRILELVGLGHGIIALTKVDLVDDEWRAAAGARHPRSARRHRSWPTPRSCRSASPRAPGSTSCAVRSTHSCVDTPAALDRGRPRLWVDRVVRRQGQRDGGHRHAHRRLAARRPTGARRGSRRANSRRAVARPRQRFDRSWQSRRPEPRRHRSHRPRTRRRRDPRRAVATDAAVRRHAARAVGTSPRGLPARCLPRLHRLGRVSRQAARAGQRRHPAGRRRAGSAAPRQAAARSCPAIDSCCASRAATRPSAAARCSTSRRCCRRRRPGPIALSTG